MEVVTPLHYQLQAELSVLQQQKKGQLTQNDVFQAFELITQKVGKNEKENLKKLIDFWISQFGITAFWSYLQQSAYDPFELDLLNREKEDGFDHQFGTCTGTIVEQYQLDEALPVERLVNATGYIPSPINTVKKLLDRLPIIGYRHSDYTFIDIGSGMGRNVLLASNYAFKQVIGVEIAPALHQVALENVATYEKQVALKSPIQLELNNALDYELPSTPLLLFFYWPFETELQVQFTRKLENWVNNNQLPVLLAFVGDVFPVVKQSTSFNWIDRFETNDIAIKGKGNYVVSIFGTT